VTTHPRRSTWRSALPRPTPEEVRRLREAAGMTLEAAATEAGLSGWRAWHKWESGEARPPSQTWELWLLRVRMHPTHELLPRRGATA
jgi:DNA-binding transcriptional regulator YiaG